MNSFNKINIKFKNILDKHNLAVNGYRYNLIEIEHKNNRKLSIAYVINNSLPETNNGYSIRSHHIIKSVQLSKIDIYPITRVGFPYDIQSIKKYATEKELYVDSVKYYRLKQQGFHFHETTVSSYLLNYTSMLLDFAIKKQVTIIHSASNYINGLASVNVAKILKLPSIYEVRGFWEITEASRDSSFKESESYKMQKRLEIQACTDSTAVIALSEIVKEELLKRGIDKKKIFVVENGVDTKKLFPLTKDKQLLSSLSLNNKFVVGFIGSVVDYEGLKLLIQVAERFNNSKSNNIRFLIVGDGNSLEYLKEEVKSRKISKLFIFTNRVPYEDVKKYYSIIDVMCYPRLDWEVCSIVSPKKPFEAMAYGVPIISSSVRANSYFIEDGTNGLLHKKGDVVSLEKAILKLYNDVKLKNSIAKNAREWVVENRDISRTATQIKHIYEKTIKKFNMDNNE